MATLIVNVSGGNLHLDSLGVMLPPGGRKEFDCSESELLVVCPELATFKTRMRVMVSEDAVIVAEEPKPVVVSPAPAAPVVPASSAPVAPVAPVETKIEVEESEDEDA